MTIMASHSPDRSRAFPLEGATLTGKVAIFLPPTGISSVEFTLYDAATTLKRTTEKSPPFDLYGTAPDGSAVMLDLASVRPGAVLVVTAVTRDATRWRRTRTQQARFAVAVPTPPVPAGVPGAVGDGRTDDTAALQRAFDAGGVIELGGRTYAHSKVLHVTRPGTRIVGPGVLLATAEATSAIRIAATGVTLEGVTARISTTTRRWDAPAQAKIHLDRTSGTVLTRVTVEGSAASGVFVQGASGFVLTDVTVRGTRADGIHMTAGASQGSLVRPVVVNSGDDGVAVVSYGGDPAVCHDIVVTAPTVRNQAGGRGLSVVGGRDVTFTDAVVESSWDAALYFAAEESWHTYGCTRVTVERARLVNSNTNAAVDHGAVLVYAGDTLEPNASIHLSGITIVDTRATASRQVGVLQDSPGARNVDVVLADFTIVGGPRWLYSTNNPAGDTTRRTGWTWNGAPVPDVTP